MLQVQLGDKLIVNGRKSKGHAYVAEVWPHSDEPFLDGGIDPKDAAGYPQVCLVMAGDNDREGKKVWVGPDDFKSGVVKMVQRFVSMNDDAQETAANNISSVLDLNVDTILDSCREDDSHVEFAVDDNQTGETPAKQDKLTIDLGIAGIPFANEYNTPFVEMAAIAASILSLMKDRKEELSVSVGSYDQLRAAALSVTSAMTDIVHNS